MRSRCVAPCSHSPRRQQSMATNYAPAGTPPWGGAPAVRPSYGNACGLRRIRHALRGGAPKFWQLRIPLGRGFPPPLRMRLHRHPLPLQREADRSVHLKPRTSVATACEVARPTRLITNHVPWRWELHLTVGHAARLCVCVPIICTAACMARRRRKHDHSLCGVAFASLQSARRRHRDVRVVASSPPPATPLGCVLRPSILSTFAL